MQPSFLESLYIALDLVSYRRKLRTCLGSGWLRAAGMRGLDEFHIQLTEVHEAELAVALERVRCVVLEIGLDDELLPDKRGQELLRQVSFQNDDCISNFRSTGCLF